MPSITSIVMTTKKSSNDKNGWSRLTVKSLPPIQDPRELNTILTHSLRSLYGDFESHSCLIEVNRGEDNNDSMIVKCPDESVSEVRAALTLITLPEYMSTTTAESRYRLDVIAVEPCCSTRRKL